MRMIDADALKDNMFHYAAPEMVWDRGDIEHKINEMPTIDAIPVEWLRGLMMEYANTNTLEHAAYAYCLNNVIEGWHEEQEGINVRPIEMAKQRTAIKNCQNCTDIEIIDGVAYCRKSGKLIHPYLLNDTAKCPHERKEAK